MSSGRSGSGPGSGSRTPTLEQVYASHVGFVWRAARRLGVPEEAVLDVAHEVFMIVHRRLPDYDGRASMRAWLFGITRGVARNYTRGRARAERRLRLVPSPEPDLDPEQLASEAEAVEIVGTFLASLDADRRIVFELAELEGMRGPEIANALGVKVNTVYSRLRLARRDLEQFVERWRAPGEGTGS